MAVYRFKVCTEDNEDVVRDIDIKAAQTFEHFHKVIQEAFKFDAKHATSFLLATTTGAKGQEITLNKEDLPLEEDEIRRGVDPKNWCRKPALPNTLNSPISVLCMCLTPMRNGPSWLKWLNSRRKPKGKLSAVIKSVGNAPKQYKQANVIKGSARSRKCTGGPARRSCRWARCRWGGNIQKHQYRRRRNWREDIDALEGEGVKWKPKKVKKKMKAKKITASATKPRGGLRPYRAFSSR